MVVRKNYINRTCDLLADLVDEYGVVKGAKKYFDHVDIVRAFFDSEIVHITIINMQDDCEEASVLAHEFTHYIQLLSGTIGSDPYTNTRNELEAEAIETIYYNAFCKESDENYR